MAGQAAAAELRCSTQLRRPGFPWMLVLTGDWCLSGKINLQLHFFSPVELFFEFLHSVSSPLLNEKGTFTATFPHGRHHQVSFLQPLLFKEQLELISGICTLPLSNSVGIDHQVQKFLGKLRVCVNMAKHHFLGQQAESCLFGMRNLLSLPLRRGDHVPFLWHLAHTDPGPVTRQVLVEGKSQFSHL